MATIALAALALAPPAAAGELSLARDGRAGVVVRVARDAIPAERTAAAELGDYLERVTGASFRRLEEGVDAGGVSTIEVGPTRRVRGAAPELDRLGPEAWVVRCDGETLMLYGGRPRGTLYAVYHFLEDVLGIRWWSPYEETVPRRPSVTVGPLELAGEPAFTYRDVYGVEGPLAFRARLRHNGQASRLPRSFGGHEAYGPPGAAHTAYAYVPPRELFAEHPEYFSEIAGFRVSRRAQLCLSAEGLVDLVFERMSRFIEQARARAAREGEDAPTEFSFSQNDWGRPCDCARCTAIRDREGSRSGTWVLFLDRLAERVARRYPGVRIDTLAYRHTLRPPRSLTLPGNVVVRLSGLHQRDFARPVRDPANAEYREALRGWAARTAHLRIWDYSVLFGEQGEFPFPNLPLLADDFRLYRDAGVEGILVQHEFPVSADLRDLKLWVLSKLLEDPAQSLPDLVTEFTEGYYGPAGRFVRRYLDELEGAARRRPAVLRYGAGPEAYTYLDRGFLVRAQRLFDRAARAAAGDEVLERRVRHARLSLDRATLVRWGFVAGGGEWPLEWGEVAARYRRTWREQVALRVGPEGVGPALGEVEREIAYWASRAGRASGARVASPPPVTLR